MQPRDDSFPEQFSTATKRWFRNSFGAPTRVQSEGWARIADGEHALLVAPTGSGKTLAAFLFAIDTLMREPPANGDGVRVLYVSPLKALVYDVERNLRAPLAAIHALAGRLDPGARPTPPGVDVRTGDTSQAERRRQARVPAEVLVTTPESLYLLLGSGARETLRSVRSVIVDEIHALAPGKRGVHLAVSLERLACLAREDPQRIGLSATVRPLSGVARFLGGDRPVRIVDTQERPRIELRVSVPVPDMERPNRGPGGRGALSPADEGKHGARSGGAPAQEGGIWPALYPQLLAEIRCHRSTIVFVNSRGLCERLAQRLNELAEEELVLAHHGSVSHGRRAEIEEGLKAGRLRAIVATSSLELGIDMGAVDRVIMVESPGSVARGLQRIGRAGHQVNAVSRGSIYPKFRGDLLESAVIAGRMLDGAIEAIWLPRNALDVLAQQLVAICCDAPRSVDALHAMVTRADPYRELSLDALHEVLEMLSGRYPSAELADLRPRLSWDRVTDVLTPRKGSAMLARINGGTIADRGNFPVYLSDGGPRIGELDEEMVFESRPGDNVMLGASTWRILQVSRDRVLVSPAPGEPGRLPFWRGDGPGRALELGEAVGALVRELAAMSRAQAARHLRRALPLDAHAAANLAAYVHEQHEHCGCVPSDRDVVVERFRDELGDWRICILTPFGARVHAPWAMALQRELEVRSGFEAQVMYTDDGIVLRLSDGDDLPEVSGLFPNPARVEGLVTQQLADSSLFAGLFRENATRALLITRRNPASRTPLWIQRQRAQALLAAVRRYPSFPVVMETYRQILADVFDVPALVGLLQRIRSRQVRMHEVETRGASPFARSLVFAYVAAFIYEQDAPLAERRAQALTLDRGMLTELLGHGELRELIDPQVLGRLQLELQCLSEDRRALDAEGLHDVLRRVGDLDMEQVRARCAGDAQQWLDSLLAQGRVVRLPVAASERFVVVEEAALYRDALGSAVPPDLPARLLARVDGALEALMARHARTNAPFAIEAPARRYGVAPARLEGVLLRLEERGRIVRGEFGPAAQAPQWCDVDVLAMLKRRSLARLRAEVAAVPATALAAFLPRWHGVGETAGHRERLEQALAQLEGLRLSWRTLVDHVLPARVAGFSTDMLDAWVASGVGVWVGIAAIGAADGRIALYRRARASVLLEPRPADGDRHPAQRAILELLGERGACFTAEIEGRVRERIPGAGAQVLEASLWSLVWAGLISHDSFAPLRSLGRRGRARHRGLAGGRWFMVQRLVDARRNPTQQALARAEMLLRRYGVVSREAVSSEELPGGFAAMYRVLRAMEDAGRVRRGHFVEGLGGAQFALPEAVVQLRAARMPGAGGEALTDEEILLIAANDPANAYGSLLPWPPTGGDDGLRPRRVAGAFVVLARGEPLLYLASGGRHLLSFPSVLARHGNALVPALAALARVPRNRRRRVMVIEKMDGEAILAPEQVAAFKAAGFVSDYRGYTLVSQP